MPRTHPQNRDKKAATLKSLLAASNASGALEGLDHELVGLAPVKGRKRSFNYVLARTCVR